MKWKGILLGVLLIGSFAFARVEKKYDDFDGTLTVKSSIDKFCSPWCNVIFGKTQHRNRTISWTLSFIRMEASRYWPFSAISIEIKVKSRIGEEVKEEIFEAQNIDTGIYRGYMSSGMWKISDELQERILNASEVTIRVYSINSPAETWLVPEKILKEWKGVINVFDEEINKQKQKAEEGE